MMSSQKNKYLAIFFVCLFVIAFLNLMTTQGNFPLFDWAYWDIQWVNAWLWMSVVDYYAVAVCFSTIIVHTETKALHSFMWVTGIMFLGSPVCCVYMIYRCALYKGLSLDMESGNALSSFGLGDRYLQISRSNESDPTVG